MSQTSAMPLVEPPLINDWTLSFTRAPTCAALEFWDACRADRPMPKPGDLNARGMKAFLSDLALIDVLPLPSGGFDFRIRLIGESAKAIFGEITGKSFGEFLAPNVERRWRSCAEAVCERKAPLRCYGTVVFGNKQWLEMETLVAPLGSGDEVERLLAVFDTWPREMPA